MQRIDTLDSYTFTTNLQTNGNLEEKNDYWITLNLRWPAKKSFPEITTIRTTDTKLAAFLESSASQIVKMILLSDLIVLKNFGTDANEKTTQQRYH